MVNLSAARTLSHDPAVEFVETDLGPLPRGWAMVKLGDVYDFKNGVNADLKDYGKGIRFANVLEVITHPHLHAVQIPGRVSLPNLVIASYLVENGDILFNRTSETQEELGLASVYDDQEPIVFGGFVIRARQRQAAFYPQYTGYAFRTPFVRKQIMAAGQGAVRANIGQQSLSKVLAPRPGRKEQQAIAGALSDADALTESLEALIAKKHAIKQAMMQDLLSGRKRLPGFSLDWKETNLGELGTFLKGSGVLKDEAQSGSLPCIRYGEIYTVHNDIVRQYHSFISPEVAQTATQIRTGDILFAGSGETKDEIGKAVALVNCEQAYAGGDIVILRPVECDASYLGYALNHHEVQRQKAARGQGDAVVHISASALASISIKLPSFEEQVAIGEVLGQLDEEIAVLGDRLIKARQIKQGMMQELLTGRVRLI